MILILAFKIRASDLRSSVLEDGVILLRKRKEFPHDVVLLEFETEKKVNEGELMASCFDGEREPLIA